MKCSVVKIDPRGYLFADGIDDENVRGIFVHSKDFAGDWSSLKPGETIETEASLGAKGYRGVSARRVDDQVNRASVADPFVLLNPERLGNRLDDIDQSVIRAIHQLNNRLSALEAATDVRLDRGAR